MKTDFEAKWICSKEEVQDVCPVFRREIFINKEVASAVLRITSLGVYEARVNNKRVGKYVMAPGWTAYKKRIQYQEYEISSLLSKENEIEVYVGKGWYSSPMPGWLETEDKKNRRNQHTGLIAEIDIRYIDGSEEKIITDKSWQWSESEIRFSEIYDGETYDANITKKWNDVVEFDGPYECLIPQEGEEINEIERVYAKKIITTPKGEIVIDFGQEITGYVEFKVEANGGETLEIYHGEVLDKDGNFYNDNYRGAKAKIKYTCKKGKQKYHAYLTFFGFRYIKIVGFPGKIKKENFNAIAVYSNISRTGYLNSGNSELNKLISNIIWSQKCNFLDVPTDCPQRDERLGWTGDVLVFIKTAGYLFDVEIFFKKWLRDLKAYQRDDGAVGQVIPDYLPDSSPSAGWGDVAVVCPWQLYQTYGNVEILLEQFDSMKKWVDYITYSTKKKGLWIGGEHFGDWLGLDSPQGSFKGSSRDDFIATAFYAYSTCLLIKAGKVINKNVAEYEELYMQIIEAFRKEFPTCKTQTEYAISISFGLSENCEQSAKELANMIIKDGKQLKTGFIGTPYLLHALSSYGYVELAYDLLLRKKYPSWLYPVERGATTVWEHWDGIMEDGTFWCDEMNSFNHYAYGAVADWIVERALGIQTIEEYPGFEKVRIEPMPDKRLGWLEGSFETRYGKIEVKWIIEEGIRYEISTDMPAMIIIDGVKYDVNPGKNIFWSNNKEITGEFI